MKADGGFEGTLAGKSTSAGRADVAYVAEKIFTGWKNTTFNFVWQSGSPALVWGTNDDNPENIYVFSTKNFDVKHAATSDNATCLGGKTLDQLLAEVDRRIAAKHP